MYMDYKKDTLLVKLDGDLDHHLATIIRIPIDQRINAEEIKNLIFDFENVNFMDSSGIGLIMGRYKLLLKKGGGIKAVNLSPSLKRIFEISGLFKIVEVK